RSVAFPRPCEFARQCWRRRERCIIPCLPFLRRQVLFALAHGSTSPSRGALTPEAFQGIARTSPKRREAERRKTHPTTDRVPTFIPPLVGRTEEGARRASGETRSPLGAPPRLSPEALRPLAPLPAMLPGTWIRRALSALARLTPGRT